MWQVWFSAAFSLVFGLMLRRCVVGYCCFVGMLMALVLFAFVDLLLTGFDFGLVLIVLDTGANHIHCF